MYLRALQNLYYKICATKPVLQSLYYKVRAALLYIVAHQLACAQLAVIAIQEGGGIEDDPQEKETEGVGLDAEYAFIDIQLQSHGYFGGVDKAENQKDDGAYDQRIGPDK